MTLMVQEMKGRGMHVMCTGNSINYWRETTDTHQPHAFAATDLSKIQHLEIEEINMCVV